MPHIVNGIDTDELAATIHALESGETASNAIFQVNTIWTGQTSSVSRPVKIKPNEAELAHNFSIVADETGIFSGSNTGINPQEILMSALNASLLVSYVFGAAMREINLKKLEIETEGTLNLKGFFGIDPDVKSGYDELKYIVRIEGDGTVDEFQEIHDSVIATSPNYFNLARPVKLSPTLVVTKEAKRIGNGVIR